MKLTEKERLAAIRWGRMFEKAINELPDMNKKSEILKHIELIPPELWERNKEESENMK